MATIYFPSPSDAELIEVEFLKVQGGTRSLQLLVDSGFTGKSSLILNHDATDLVRAEVPTGYAMGALQGPQDRAWVTCRIPGLSFERPVIAILADLASLSLPAGVGGMAGLSFLRQFIRWGAEQTEGGGWQFFLSAASDG